MHVSARSDYAVRAVVELAVASPNPCTAEALATRQAIPQKFLNAIMLDLKRARIVGSVRGTAGGYFLARPAETVSVADIMRAVEGQLADVRGIRPEALEYTGSAAPLTEVWVAARAALRSVLESVTVADLASGTVPMAVSAMVADDAAWR